MGKLEKVIIGLIILVILAGIGGIAFVLLNGNKENTMAQQDLNSISDASLNNTDIEEEIYGLAVNSINKVNIDETEKLLFNNTFTQYEGDSVRGANVKSLLSRISSLSDDYPTVILYYNLEEVKESEIQNLINDISSSSSYSVTLGYKDGIVNKVEIKEK